MQPSNPISVIDRIFDERKAHEKGSSCLLCRRRTAITAVSVPKPAEAGGGWGWGPGIAGGLIAGAIIGGIASSAYGYGPGYYGPGYGYGGYAPGYAYGGGYAPGYYGGYAPGYYGGYAPGYQNGGYGPAPAYLRIPTGLLSSVLWNLRWMGRL